MLKAFLFCIVAIAILGAVGYKDYEDELIFTLDYCQGIEQGSWPDYKRLASKDCSQENIAKIRLQLPK